MIFYLYATVLSFVLRDLALLMNISHHSQLSLREYLYLESRYHPSWIVRAFFRYLYRKLSQGLSLSQIGAYFGIFFDSPQTSVKDFQKIFDILSQPHPVPYPFLSLFRLSVVIVFAYSQKILSFYDEKIFFVGILGSIIAYEWFSWVDYRVYTARLFIAASHLKKDIVFFSSVPRPKYLRNSYENNMWTDLYHLTHSLENTENLYQYYWGVFKKRDCVKRRQSMQMIMDLSMFLFFIMIVVPLLEQSYQMNF